MNFRITIKAFLYVLLVCAGINSPNAWAFDPFVGLQIQGLTPAVSKSLGLEGSHGVLVRDIAFPGPASASEINRGDVIIKLDDEEVKGVEEVVEFFSELKAGTKIQATVFRRGKKIELPLEVTDTPALWSDLSNSFTTIPALGVTFAALTEKVRKRFNLGWNTRGIVVSLVDEKISTDLGFNLDLKVGDVVVQINQHNVWEPKQIVEYMKMAKDEKKDTALFLIERTDGFRFALLPVPK